MTVVALQSAWCQYPTIDELDGGDLVFRQQQEDVAAFHRAWARGERTPPVLLYRYDPSDKDDLFSLAARANLPYDTLASLNSLEHPADLAARSSILIPNMITILAVIPVLAIISDHY